MVHATPLFLEKNIAVGFLLGKVFDNTRTQSLLRRSLLIKLLALSKHRYGKKDRVQATPLLVERRLRDLSKVKERDF